MSVTYQNEVLQPCVRAGPGRSLEDSRALSSLLAGRAGTRASVSGGNSRLIERLIRLSGADLQLNSSVTTIGSGHSRRYRLAIWKVRPGQESRVKYAEFDAVIIASPLYKNGVDLTQLDLQSALMSGTAYSEAHVTHFTTPAALSSNLSNCPLDVYATDNDILTTSAPAADVNILTIRESQVCYKRGCLPGDDCDQCEFERLYRVHSRRHMTDADLLRLIDAFPETDGHVDLSSSGISWVHRRHWRYAFPGPPQSGADIPQQIEIAPQLYYLGAAEEVVSSMEMSCRMGRNAAKRLYWRSVVWRT